MLDTEIFLGGIMKNDYEGDVERDIKKFNETGKLPQDFDVRNTSGKSQSSPYWNYITQKMGGREPLFNSGDIPVDEPSESTDKAAAFREWLLSDYPKLSDDDKEIFTMVWEKGVAIDDMAKYLGVSRRTAFYKVERLKARIAKWVGIKL